MPNTVRAAVFDGESGSDLKNQGKMFDHFMAKPQSEKF